MELVHPGGILGDGDQVAERVTRGEITLDEAKEVIAQDIARMMMEAQDQPAPPPDLEVESLRREEQELLARIESGALTPEESIRLLVDHLARATELCQRRSYRILCNNRELAELLKDATATMGRKVALGFLRELGIKISATFARRLEWMAKLPRDAIDEYADAMRDSDGEITMGGLWRWMASGKSSFDMVYPEERAE